MPVPESMSGGARKGWPVRTLVLFAAIAVVLAAVAMSLVARISNPFQIGPGETRITHDVVVERVTTVAKLVSSETTLRDVVVYENTRLGSTKRSLIVVTGKVLAGIDLEAGSDVAIDHDARRITVTLPRAKVLAVEITGLRTYDESAGLWNPFRPSDRDAIYAQVRTRLSAAGQELGVVEHANRSAEQLLETLLSTDGYTAEVTYRAPVERSGARS